MILKKFAKNVWLKSRNLSEEKTHPEHKYSVTFVAKDGTIRILIRQAGKLSIDPLQSA